jgi:RNA polymerase sigma factor (sigma-70 family)
VDDIRVDHDEISESLDNGTEFAFAMTILDEQPELTKQIVRMYFFDQMTYLEIAQRLNIGVTTAKDRVKKAIGAVQQRAVVSCCK